MKLPDTSLMKLLDWFKSHGRLYPWSNSSNPWDIWVSEVMLQQTTTSTVAKRFSKWLERYPSPASLAEAEEEDFLRAWEGLGYYNRARNLAAAAREVLARYGGKIPADMENFRALPGVGDYIAAAVGSIAFGERKLAIDANLRRIALRLAGRPEWGREFERVFRREIEDFMLRMKDMPGDLNAALMQLGQIVCTPRAPKCEACPFEADCVARSRGLEKEIPRRGRQRITRTSTKIAILLLEKRVFMVRRSSGIVRGLWVFPARELLENVLDGWKSMGELNETIHSYTCFRERLLPELFRPQEGKLMLPDEALGSWRDGKELDNCPMPTAYRRIAGQLPVNW